MAKGKRDSRVAQRNRRHAFNLIERRADVNRRPMTRDEAAAFVRAIDGKNTSAFGLVKLAALHLGMFGVTRCERMSCHVCGLCGRLRWRCHVPYTREV